MNGRMFVKKARFEEARKWQKVDGETERYKDRKGERAI
jgi:hypothetical protein